MVSQKPDTTIISKTPKYDYPRLVLTTLGWAAVAVFSSWLITNVFFDQWQRILISVSQTAPIKTTAEGAAKTKTVTLTTNHQETPQVATISATFITDLISAIMDATNEAQLASAEAELIRDIEIGS